MITTVAMVLINQIQMMTTMMVKEKTTKDHALTQELNMVLKKMQMAKEDARQNLSIIQ